MKGWIGFWVLCLWVIQLVGQESPTSLANQPLGFNVVPKFTIQKWDNDSLREAELGRRSDNPGRSPRFAQVTEVNVSTQSHGQWIKQNNETWVWRLTLESKEAYSLNLGFTDFYLPPSAQLLIHGVNPKSTYGPFTPADNEVHNALWTPVIPGDALILELQISDQEKSNLRLQLRFINHDYMGFGKSPVSTLRQVGAALGDCHVDVVCDEETGWPQVDQFRAAIQSVGILSIDGERTCTGYLVNNSQQDCTPYFITAAHCEIDRTQARSMVVYWNFQNSYCRQINSFENGQSGNGELTVFNTGAFLLASSEASDFILLRLDDPVPEAANAYFAGWDNRQEIDQGLFTSIHHPLTEEKRISFSEAPVYAGKWGEGTTAFPDGDHLIIPRWTIGTTEDGSSGGPLLNEEGLVVGQLHGGRASCDNNDYDAFGRFANAWSDGSTAESRLMDWLDPQSEGLERLEGRWANLCALSLTSSGDMQTICLPDSAHFNLQVSEAFAGTVSLSVLDLPVGWNATFSRDQVQPGDSLQLVVYPDNIDVLGFQHFQIQGDDGINQIILELGVETRSLPIDFDLIGPNNGIEIGSNSTTLVWQSSSEDAAYSLSIADNIGFQNAQVIPAIKDTFYQIENLSAETIYFWQVNAINSCGT
ncbi:MAG: serine protease, partial [Bacteroidota bacterium]